MTKTHKEWVKDQLEREGRISRNQALRNFVSRLASRIADLRQEGWEFDIKREEGDYVYVVKERPSPKPLTFSF